MTLNVFQRTSGIKAHFFAVYLGIFSAIPTS